MWGFYYEKKHTGSRYNPIQDKNENYTKIKLSIVDSEEEYLKQVTRKMIKIEEEIKMNSYSPEREKKTKILKNTLITFHNSVKDLIKRRERVFKPGFAYTLDDFENV